MLELKIVTISVFFCCVFSTQFKYYVWFLFGILSFVAIWVVTIWVWSLVTIWVEFCHKLSFCILLQFKLISIAVWVFYFCYNLSIGAQFRLLSFVTIWVFEFCHNLIFWFGFSHNSKFCVVIFSVLVLLLFEFFSCMNLRFNLSQFEFLSSYILSWWTITIWVIELSYFKSKF